MKTVWILNHYAQDPRGSGGTRHFSLARHLRDFGWDTAVIAASVELNTGRQRLAEHEAYRLDDFDGVPFLWIRTPEYEGNSGGRIRNMLSYALRVVLPGATRQLRRPDVVIGSSVHPFTAWAGAILAKRHQVPFVFEVRDLWPQTLIDMGRLSEGSLTTRGLQYLEKWLYRRASSIIVLLPRAADYIVPLGIPEQRIAWIPNGVALDAFPKPPAPVDRKTFTLMYFGAHGQANGLDHVINAMAEIKDRMLDRRIELRLIGDGPTKPALQDQAHRLNLDNVIFETPVPKKDIPTIAAGADAFVFNLIDAPVFRYGISSNKLFDFLAAARPIVFCCESSNNPVNEAGAGPTVAPGNVADLADAIEALVHTPLDKRIAMGDAGRRYVEQNHDFALLAGKLGKLLDQLTSSQP